MSSILRALRKLESEKSELGEGSLDLARDILKRSYDERRSSPVWLIVAFVLAAVMLGAGWWLYTSQQGPQQALIPLETPVAPVAATAPVASEKPPLSAPPVVIMPNRVPKPTVESIPQSPKVTAAKTALPREAEAPAPLLIPDLTIEEIVFVADPGARLAVINDLPVMQGTDIDGARVVEILSDRVRFEFQGIRFDKFITLEK